MSVLELSRSVTPPTDLRAERLFLSACLLATASDRDAAVARMVSGDFHDPFHSWTLRAMRHHRRKEGADFLLAVIQEGYEDSPPTSGGRPVHAEIRALLYDDQLHPIAGEVRRLSKYAAAVKKASQLRLRQVELEAELLAILRERELYATSSYWPARARLRTSVSPTSLEASRPAR